MRVTFVVLAIALVLALSVPVPSRAGTAPVGSEFQINTFTDADGHSSPAVAMNDAVSFVVVWRQYDQDGDRAGVFGQRFNSVGKRAGSAFRVNSYTTGIYSNPDIAMDASGDFVVVWESRPRDGPYSYQRRAFGRRFDSGGVPVGFEFQVTTSTDDPGQKYPAVAMDYSGRFAVVWLDVSQPLAAISGQRYDQNGFPVASEFQANTSVVDDWARPDIASNGFGRLVVVWRQYGQDGDRAGVFGRLFEAWGATAGLEFQVNSYTTSYQRYPAVTWNDSGHFVVVWSGDYQDGDSAGIFGQRYDSSGYTLGGEFQVNTYTTHAQLYPAVASDAGGRVMVVWETLSPSLPSWVSGIQLDSTGAALGFEFETTPILGQSYRHDPAIATDGSGGFVFVYLGGDVYGQRFFADGPAITSPVAGSTIDCSRPELGRPTIRWETGLYDRFKVFLSGDGTFTKRYRVSSGDKLLRTDSWTPGEKKWRRACNKALAAAADPNSPLMYIAVRGIDRELRKKDPLRKLLSFPVRTNVQP